MQFKPYSYQEDCLAALKKARGSGQNRALVIMASGLGKTVTAAFDVRRWLWSHRGRVLYICHQNDILTQARTTFEDVLSKNFTYGFYQGQEKEIGRVNCLFASFQAMREGKNGFRPKTFSYIVVDESHHGYAHTYHPTLRHFRPKFLLGITATPERGDLKDIREIYGNEIFSLPIEDALAQSLLTPVDYYLLTDKLNIQELRKLIKTPIGRLSVKDLNRRLFIPRRDKEIARIILRHMAKIQNPRVMIFCPSILYCERLAAFLPYAMAIHSKLPYSEQQDRLNTFRNGFINTVLTVDKFNEGIDIPEANIIVFLRSTSSRRIFYQQLGRGLRRHHSKKRVLVLDFVANCDRLETVHRLWKSVAKKAPTKSLGDKPISIDIGTVKFSKIAKKILDLLTSVRRGYTREILIRQIRNLANKLGRAPTQLDIRSASKLNECASPPTFYQFFGSINKAKEAAGLPIQRLRKYDKTLIITQLKSLARRLGRTPRETDVKIANQMGKSASAPLLYKVFGSLNKALKAAGLRPNVRRDYSKEEIIKQLKGLAKTLERIPRSSDITKASKKKQCASFATIARTFGSLSSALLAAKFTVTTRKGVKYKKEEVKRGLQLLKKRLKRVPTFYDIERGSKARLCASYPTLVRCFGSFRAALRAAKLIT